MNYKWHTRISLSVVLLATVCLELFWVLPVQEVALFLFMGYFHTVYASPDIDHQKSTPTKKMGIIGKITSTLCTHRGLLHRPWFWGLFYLALAGLVWQRYNYSTWWFSGGLIALYVHIALDKISTKVKRTFTKLKRKLHF